MVFVLRSKSSKVNPIKNSKSSNLDPTSYFAGKISKPIDLVNAKKWFNKFLEQEKELAEPENFAKAIESGRGVFRTYNSSNLSTDVPIPKEHHSANGSLSVFSSIDPKTKSLPISFTLLRKNDSQYGLNDAKYALLTLVPDPKDLKILDEILHAGEKNPNLEKNADYVNLRRQIRDTVTRPSTFTMMDGATVLKSDTETGKIKVNTEYPPHQYSDYYYGSILKHFDKEFSSDEKKILTKLTSGELTFPDVKESKDLFKTSQEREQFCNKVTHFHTLNCKEDAVNYIDSYSKLSDMHPDRGLQFAPTNEMTVKVRSLYPVSVMPITSEVTAEQQEYLQKANETLKGLGVKTIQGSITKDYSKSDTIETISLKGNGESYNIKLDDIKGDAIDKTTSREGNKI